MWARYLGLPIPYQVASILREIVLLSGAQSRHEIGSTMRAVGYVAPNHCGIVGSIMGGALGRRIRGRRPRYDQATDMSHTEITLDSD